MRVLFPVAGGPTHLFPLIPLAWALRAAGHEVLLAGTPKNADTMTRTGVAAVTVGSGPKLSPAARERLVSVAYGQGPWPADWPAHPEFLDAGQLALLEALGEYSIAGAEGMADDLVAFAHEWQPDLIVHDTIALGGAIAAEILGVPGLRYAHGTQDVFLVEYRISDGQPLPGLTSLFERFGLDAPVVPPSYLDTMPSSMFLGGERPRVAMRWVPYNGSGLQPDQLSGPRRRPRVCVTWGMVVPSALGSAAADPFRDVLTAAGTVGADVLLLTSPAHIESLGPPPAHVRYLPNTPLHLVLPYCDGIVHHGGEGTSMAAATLAVPQLIVTREPLDDQHGGRLAATGAAIHLRHQHLVDDPAGRDQIADAIEKLVSDPHHAEAALRLADDIETLPTPAEVVASLVALADTKPPETR